MVSIYPGAITTLAEGTAFTDDDYLLFVDDPGGTPVTRYITAANARASGLGVYWPRTALEIANSITPTDYTYEPGNVMRYGAVADSGDSLQGTDCHTAFQNAVNSGHAVYVPEGWYAVESTIEVFNKSTAGLTGVHIQFAAGSRVERYANDSTPILHVAGFNHRIEGNGATLAGRTYGGWTKGIVLLGPDPALTSNSDDSCLDTTNNWISDLKIFGRTGTTTWDGSVGFYCESAQRRRGQYITPTTINCYYNVIRGCYAIQIDYGFFLSSDANANTFSQCEVHNFGHAAVLINGYGNVFNGFIAEPPTAQDATERAVFHFGEKDFGPEGTHQLTDEDATSYSITAISKASSAVVTIGAHTFNATDLVRITGVVDTGAGGNGDFAQALNNGHFEVTATDATTITISVDTSGLTDSYSSGGTAFEGALPIYGAYANHVDGFTEFAFDASTRKVRLCLFEDPLRSFDTRSEVVNAHKNNIQVVGNHPGGIAKSGFSTYSSVYRNRVDNTTVGFTDYMPQFRAGNLTAWQLDDDSGAPPATTNINHFGYGSKYHQTYSGRMANMDESEIYTVLTVDNVGITSASILIKLSYVFKEAANQDHEGGQITWLCPVYSSTGQAPVKLLDQTGIAGTNHFAAYLTWSVLHGPGTTASTGKFQLRVQVGAIPGSGNGFCTWKAEILHDNIQDSNLDWPADVTIQNGGLNDTGGAE